MLRNEDGEDKLENCQKKYCTATRSQISSFSAKYFSFLREMRKLHLTETECARHVSQMSAHWPPPPPPHMRSHPRAVTSASQTEILSHLATGSLFSQLSVIMELRYGMRGTSWPQLPGCPFLLPARGLALASGHHSPHL